MENDATGSKVIVARAVDHKGGKRIKLVFKYDTAIISKVRQIAGARWSQTMKAWHIAVNPTIIAQLKQQFGLEVIIGEQKTPKIEPDPIIQKSKDNHQVILQLDKVNDIIYIVFPGKFERAWIDTIKTFRGRWYDPDKKRWGIKYIDENLPEIEKLFKLKMCQVRIEEIKTCIMPVKTTKKYLKERLCPQGFTLEMRRRNYSERTIRN